MPHGQFEPDETALSVALQIARLCLAAVVAAVMAFAFQRAGAPWWAGLVPIALFVVIALSTLANLRLPQRRSGPGGPALPAEWVASGAIPTGRFPRTTFHQGFSVTIGASPLRTYPWGKLLLRVEQGRATVGLRPGLRTWTDRLFRPPPPVVFVPTPQTHVVPVSTLASNGGIYLQTGNELPVTVWVDGRPDALAALASAGFVVQQQDVRLPLLPEPGWTPVAAVGTATS